MKIGLFINDIQKEQPNYATTRLALEAIALGHEVWYISASDFAYDPDDLIRARALGVKKKKYSSGEALVSELQNERAKAERITVDSLDVLLLRNDPADDADRPWAQSVGITFGEVAVAHGVIVLNDPLGLSQAMNKLYFQQFPEEVRPRTLITRTPEDIKAFVRDQNGEAVLKPLQGSGGQGVFLIRREDSANLNQMIDAVTRDGYVIVQEYLPAAEAGDTRLFLMNGLPLAKDGKYAAMARTRAPEDIRSNIHAGGKAARAEVTDSALHLAEAVRPKLVKDGMFLVGLDIVGDKLMEINVFSPGGLSSIQKLTGVNFAREVIRALERKVAHHQLYGGEISNTVLACL